ncbi:MAG: hypothetical protein M5U09_16215 [Gammaproteobacteria bacterium]|nr:hypothetical protein [Gammaproteobacteria bacterium]
MSADVRLENLWIKFGTFVAVRDVDLTIKGASSSASLALPGAARPRSCAPFPGF